MVELLVFGLIVVALGVALFYVSTTSKKETPPLDLDLTEADLTILPDETPPPGGFYRNIEVSQNVSETKVEAEKVEVAPALAPSIEKPKRQYKKKPAQPQQAKQKAQPAAKPARKRKAK